MAFRIAFSLGRKGVNDGVTAGIGKTLELSINTTVNTKMDIPATKRNINLSVMI